MVSQPDEPEQRVGKSYSAMGSPRERNSRGAPPSATRHSLEHHADMHAEE